MTRSLYITHTGMTEPLGQSQVLPYLKGLAKKGVEIDLVSFEPTGTDPDLVAAEKVRLSDAGLSWHPQVRSKSHALGVKVWESSIASMKGLILALKRRPDIVHARSYLPAAVADVVAALSPNAKLLFDCRGMLGDEYVDCGNWTTDRIEYKLLKRVEKHLFQRTDGLVVLTDALRRWLVKGGHLGHHTKVQVIPCCVDTDKFNTTLAVRNEARAKLGVGDRFVVAYAGSLGTWYLEPEMAKFFNEVKKLRKDALFVVFTRGDATSLKAKVLGYGFSEKDILVTSVSPKDMPSTLPAGDVGLSFIQSCFSKTGSSPTKVAEYLASGLPVVVNGDIGDQADLAVETKACSVLSSFSDDAFRIAAEEAVRHGEMAFEERVKATNDVVRRHFSLAELGVPRYEALYRSLAQGS